MLSQAMPNGGYYHYLPLSVLLPRCMSRAVMDSSAGQASPLRRGSSGGIT